MSEEIESACKSDQAREVLEVDVGLFSDTIEAVIGRIADEIK